MTIVIQSVAIEDGRVYVGGNYRNEKLSAYRLPTHNGESASFLWKTQRNVLGYASPLVVGELVYVVNEMGILSCIDANSGAIRWQERLGGSFSASSVYAAGKVYVLNDQGNTTVVHAKPEFEVLARNELGRRAFGSPAIANGRLFIRTAEELWCIDEKRR